MITSFHVRTSTLFTINIPFNTNEPELLQPSLNKPQTNK